MVKFPGKSFLFRLVFSLGLLFTLCFQVGKARVLSQETGIVSGYVRDATSGESLISANLLFTGNHVHRVSTNAFGFFSIALPIGDYRLEVSFVGYRPVDHPIRLMKDSVMDLTMEPAGRLDEVVVGVNPAREQLHNPQMGLSKVEVKDLRQVPVLFGEQDILKTIQLLPGVMSGGEGNSQFFVRGGTGDQNLILLDGAPVFNASHLFGFFSTFNSDAIKDVTLYKGSMPAQYGGRLASVLDIRMQEGNNKRFKAEGGLGLIASRLKLEGPLVRDKGSFVLSGRRTYADLFLKLSPDEDINGSRLYFYDLNLKSNYRIDQKNSVYLSGYSGKDMLGYSDVFRFGWGNANGSLRWNHLWNNQLFSNTTVVYSDYKYRVDLIDEAADFVIASDIRSYHLKNDFQFYASPGSTWNFGMDVQQQRIRPTQITAGENASVNSLKADPRHAAEFAFYVSHDWSPMKWLQAIYGLRTTGFSLYTTPKASYLRLEPRVSLNARTGVNTSVKAAYSRNAQFLHQLSNTTSSLPTDTWMMSSRQVKPQLADLYSLGYYHNFMENRYEFSVESYYKTMKNQIEYRDGADTQANPDLESELTYGKGRAYGLEVYVRKRAGNWNGWISYTLSKTERQFEMINQGHWFNARQDRTHDFSGVLIHHLSNRWNLSATLVYATGNAVTLPSGKYQVQGQTMYYYSERNGYRMPDYHRLDLSATWTARSNRRMESSWSFGVYNAYNRKNAYIIDFRDHEEQPGRTDIYRIALFGSIPSVTWNFSF